MSKIKILHAVSTEMLEVFVNEWLEKNHENAIILDIKFVCGEYGRHYVMIHYGEYEEDE